MVYPKIYQGVIDFMEEATGEPFETPFKPHWIKINPTRKKSNKYKCSECQSICYTSQWWDSCHYKFCPNCGKEMIDNRYDNNT